MDNVLWLLSHAASKGLQKSVRFLKLGRPVVVRWGAGC